MADSVDNSNTEDELGTTRATRRRLYHATPGWVETGAIFFITVCCKERGRSQLDNAPVFNLMANALDHYVQSGRLWCSCFLAMPDHWHALMSFPKEEQMESVLRDWKRYVARQAGVVWQDGFFDHRIRSEADETEKWNYIRENPVQADLCADPAAWPWIWKVGRVVPNPPV